MRIAALFLAALTLMGAEVAKTDKKIEVRLKEVARLQGVRGNQLLGYGVVVGLDGTGDKDQTKFTVQSLTNLMSRQGLTINPATVKVKNVAAVMVTAELPAFARTGSRLDVTVSSTGDAKSLAGGTLLMTALQGPDSQTYAVAQGPLLVGGFSASAGGASVTKNHPTVGRVPSVNPSRPGPRMHSGQTMAVEGPMARSVRDLRLGLEVMSQGDHRDGVWVPAPLVGPAAKKRVALMPAPAGYDVHPACSEAVRQAGRHLAEAGYEVEEIEVPEFRKAAELWDVIGLPQLNLNLVPALKRIADPALSDFVTHWIEAKGLADLTGFILGLAERDRLLTVWNQFMESFPVILLPNCPSPFLETELDTRGREGALATLDGIRFQFPCPVLGLPGLSVPVGLFGGQPMGVQMISRRFREDLLLEAAEVVEAREGIFTPIDPVTG